MRDFSAQCWCCCKFFQKKKRNFGACHYLLWTLQLRALNCLVQSQNALKSVRAIVQEMRVVGERGRRLDRKKRRTAWRNYGQCHTYKRRFRLMSTVHFGFQNSIKHPPHIHTHTHRGHSWFHWTRLRPYEINVPIKLLRNRQDHSYSTPLTHTHRL